MQNLLKMDGCCLSSNYTSIGLNHVDTNLNEITSDNITILSNLNVGRKPNTCNSLNVRGVTIIKPNNSLNSIITSN